MTGPRLPDATAVGGDGALAGRAGIDATDIAGLVEALRRDGYAVAPGCLEVGLVAALAAEARHLDAAGAVHDAGVGRGGAHALETRIRRSRIVWLDGASEAQQRLFATAEALRGEINRRLFLGLFEFEAQFGIHGPGDFYKRHLDSFTGARNRMVTLVIYLNENWCAEDGGALAIWPEKPLPQATDCGAPALRVLPEAGTVVLMLSEDIPHEVEPATRERLAIAGWWRVRQAD
ncbi:MAG: 2OG-Fe(II) oxygenase [Hyphomicrobiaceae bacterium]|nr:2OG-Fe(II) oxygenase [Hyphomicrobiaceae bacterium]